MPRIRVKRSGFEFTGSTKSFLSMKVAARRAKARRSVRTPAKKK
jgi:hypothetical protein